jgi:hypothetical protein
MKPKSALQPTRPCRQLGDADRPHELRTSLGGEEARDAADEPRVVQFADAQAKARRWIDVPTS